VGDKDGLRLQLFDLTAASARYRRDYDLQRPEYSQFEQWWIRQGGSPPADPKDGPPPFFHCRSGTVHALGGDEAWVGDGTGSCRLAPEGFTYTIASSSSQGAICKLTVRHPRIRPTTSQYVAIATYNPNVGPCWSTRGKKDTRLDTTAAVVWFTDEEMHRPLTVSLGTNEVPDGALVGPRRISLPAPGMVFVQDDTTHGHYFGEDGAFAADSASRDAWKPGQTERIWLELTEGAPVSGEVFGYYRKQAWKKNPILGTAQSSWQEQEHGVGRYRTQKSVLYGRDILVLEPVWERHFSEPHPAYREANQGLAQRDVMFVMDIVYNPVSNEVIALVNEDPSDPSRPDDVRLVAYPAADGVGKREVDLPEASLGRLSLGTFTDLAVSPDGDVLVLDQVNAEVSILAAAGGVEATLAVPGDTRRIAGGPADTVFVLRGSGYVERVRRADGAVTARFDARLAPRSDPATLTALVADGSGRVYVTDGLSNVVLVYEPGASSTLQPGEGECVFASTKDAQPARLFRGDSTRVTLGLMGQCGIGAAPADIVIVAQLLDPSDRRMVRRVIDIVSGVDVHRHRIGFVGSNANNVQALTDDRSAVIRAAGRYFPGSVPVKLALQEARKLIDVDDGRQHVILLSWYYCSKDLDVLCRDPLAEPLAEEITSAGIRIVVARSDRNDVPDHARLLASSGEDVIPPGADPLPRLVQYTVPENPATNLTLTDRLPANMHLVPGSPNPAAVVTGPEVRWDAPVLGESGARFTLDVQPQEAGRWPTNSEAAATFTDGWGQARRVVFPVPEVEVLDNPPTATPTAEEPTSTPPPTVTPATPTVVGPTRVPTGTPGETRWRVCLPWLANGFEGPE